MKKNLKWLLIIIGAILVVLTGLGLYYFYPMLVMAPAKTGEIPGTNIYAVKNMMGTLYFIKTDDGYILIDAGSNVKKLVASLKKSNIDCDAVKWIFITHSDYDHVAGLNLFPNARIYMSVDEFPLINGAVNRSNSGGNTLPAGIEINAVIPLLDGQMLSYKGTNIECIQAPGHTIGSMVYLVDGKYLFTGDVFMVNKNALYVHPFTMDTELAEKTIKQLRDTIRGSSMVLTSHYGYYNNLNRQ